MATITKLITSGALIALGGGLDALEMPERLMCAFPHVIQWFRVELPTLPSDLSGGKQSPLEQVDELLHDFVSGADFSFYQRSHSMKPGDAGIWELKTHDVRLFGWFAARNVFVVANSVSAFLCKEHDLYRGFLTNSVFRRDRLELDEPKFLTGGYEHVF